MFIKVLTYLLTYSVSVQRKLISIKIRRHVCEGTLNKTAKIVHLT